MAFGNEKAKLLGDSNTDSGRMMLNFTRGLQKVLGYGIGMNFKEELLAIKEDNHRVIQTGMVFNIRLSLTNFAKQPDTPTQRNCLLLADTLIVLKEGAEVLTRSVTRSYGEISYFLDDEVEENPKAQAPTVKAAG